MPATHGSPVAGAGTPKRPSLHSRTSSGPVTQVRPNSDILSTSAQRHKASSRHVVGRIGPRVPSTKNLSKLTKFSTANTPIDSTSPQQQMGYHKRNSSTQALTQNRSSTNLRKNHSETSLKKNRSNGQLVKLPRPHSSRNVRIHGRREGKRHSQVIAPEGLENPTVRFNLGDEVNDDQDESWVEESASVSPSTTRSNTRTNTSSHEPDRSTDRENQYETRSAELTRAQRQKEEEVLEQQDVSLMKPRMHEPEKASRNENEMRTAKAVSDRDNITERLLHRNVSFSTTSHVSSVSATGRDSSTFHKVGSQGQDHNSRELVSRFINGGSSNGTPRESSFLPHYDRVEHDVSDADTIKRSKSAKSMHREFPQKSVHHSASGSSTSLPSSRTQQKLWLERASSNLEPQQGMPISLMRPGRPGSLPLQALGSDGRLNAQLKHLFDQTDVEYCRVRLFQHPLTEAINRLKETGIVAQASTPTNASTRRATHGRDTAQHSLSVANVNDQKETETKKTKVMFQGIKEEEDYVEDARTTTDMTDKFSNSDLREQAKAISRRLWQRDGANLGFD